MDCIAALKSSLDRVAEKEMLPLQTGDVLNTCADLSDLFEQFRDKPSTIVAMGVSL
jgi:UDP-glucuronate 4-epimerase